MLKELYSAALASLSFNWGCSPAVTEPEIKTLDWVAKIFRLPPCFLSSGTGGNVIQTSASYTLLSAVVAARTLYLDDITSHLHANEKEIVIAHKKGRLVVLGSEILYWSIERVAKIVGATYRAMPVSLMNKFNMTAKGLILTLEQCRKEGLEPFFLTATLGTSLTCAVDNLHEIGNILKQNPNVWAYIDAAYAGAAFFLKEYQHLSENIGEYDSFSVNLRKWLLVNIDTRYMTSNGIRESKSLSNGI